MSAHNTPKEQEHMMYNPQLDTFLCVVEAARIRRVVPIPLYARSQRR